MWFSTLKFKWKQQEKKNAILDFQFKFQPKLQQNLPVTNQHLIFEIVRIRTKFNILKHSQKIKRIKAIIKILRWLLINSKSLNTSHFTIPRQYIVYSINWFKKNNILNNKIK